VYTAAYTLAAAQAALERCIAEHGRWVQARIITDGGPASAPAV
jgi:hypothetical protein